MGDLPDPSESGTAVKQLAELDGLTRDDWLTLRRRGIGGSDAAAVVGLHPYMSPLALYYDKRGEGPDADENEAMLLGSLLEDVVAAEVARRTGLRVERVSSMYAHDDHEWMLANPDRWVFDEQDRLGIVEIKTTSAWLADNWGDDIADPALIQWQHYAEVCDVEWGIVAALIGGQRIEIHRIERDRELGASLVEAEAEFWQRVQDGRPPPADGSASTTEVLNMVWTDVEGCVELSGEAEKALRRLADVKAELAELDQEKAALENVVKAELADREEGTVGGERAVTWKRSASRRVDTTALREAHPDLAAEFTVEKFSRRFLPKGLT